MMVGDKACDVEAGPAAGAAGGLPLTEYARGALEHRRGYWPGKPDHGSEDLSEAVE
jgi:phosphoglycolate phosphatase-like HAD superfamily hydrolase